MWCHHHNQTRLLAAVLLLTRTASSLLLDPSVLQFDTPHVQTSNEQLHVNLRFDEVDYNLSFLPNKELYSTKYKETIDHGEIVLEGPPMHHCHYHVSLGDLPEHPHVHGAISACDNGDDDNNKMQQPRARGLLSFDGELVALEPVYHLPGHVQKDRRARELSEQHTHALV